MWLIGLDDTDMPDTRGTGRLARMLADALAERGLRDQGVTRHQLWVHPSVPYTSHNSAACLAVAGTLNGAGDDFAWVCRFVADHSPAGADPGVCLGRPEAVGREAMAFGRRAQREWVRRQEAEAIAQQSGLRLAGLAGTRDGMIGALAAVGLRAEGNDGRFIGLGGIRELGETARVTELLAAGIDAVACRDGPEPQPDDRVETLGWARPRLLDGRAVLLVQRSHRDDVEWIVADRRTRGRGPDPNDAGQ